jgi:hypothetical protein
MSEVHGSRLWANTPQWIQGHGRNSGVPSAANLHLTRCCGGSSVHLIPGILQRHRIRDMLDMAATAPSEREKKNHEIISEHPCGCSCICPTQWNCFARAARVG